MPEYLSFRCCMCPNINNPDKVVCPPSAYEDAGLCRFVKKYIDKRGWKYRVMGGLGENNFKARWQKPEKHGSDGWHCVKQLPRRRTFDAAQSDLNALAKAKQWEECI
jgi:hypothetical protein